MADSRETEDDALVQAEFEALANRAGIDILEDRREAMLASYRDYRRMTALLHAPREAVVESASIFSIESIKRTETSRKDG